MICNEINQLIQSCAESTRTTSLLSSPFLLFRFVFCILLLIVSEVTTYQSRSVGRNNREFPLIIPRLNHRWGFPPCLYAYRQYNPNCPAFKRPPIVNVQPRPNSVCAL